MKKKLLSSVLAFCMMLTMLPVTALATASTDAGLTSVLGETITAGGEAGSAEAPKTAAINVANTVGSVAAANVVAATSATVTFYGTDSTFAAEDSDGVTLTAGSSETVYIKVVAEDASTTLHYKVTITVAPAASTDAGLTSVLGETITAGGEAGSAEAPKTAAINVANTVGSVAAANIVAATSATVTFYGTDSTFAAEDSDGVTLTAGSSETVYIKVVAEDASTTLHYKVIITVAPTSDFSIDTISAESAGGVGVKRTVNVSGTFTGNEYLVVQYTEGSGETAKVTATCIQLTAGTTTVDISSKTSSEVYVLITSGMPNLTTPDDLGVTVYASKKSS